MVNESGKRRWGTTVGSDVGERWWEVTSGRDGRKTIWKTKVGSEKYLTYLRLGSMWIGQWMTDEEAQVVSSRNI